MKKISKNKQLQLKAKPKKVVAPEVVVEQEQDDSMGDFFPEDCGEDESLLSQIFGGAPEVEEETKIEKFQKAGLLPGLFHPEIEQIRVNDRARAKKEQEESPAAIERRMLAKEITDTLPGFTGTDHYYKMNWLKLTDGCCYLAEKAGAYWLFTIAESCKHVKAVAREEFQVYKLKVDLENSTGMVTVEDGNGKVLYKQHIQYTDFCLPSFEFCVEGDVALLPSEH